MLLICRIRDARRRAREAAIAEVLCLLRDLGADPARGGPLGEQPGVFWVALPPGARERAVERLPRLGYTAAVDVAEPLDRPPAGQGTGQAAVRWRGAWYRLARAYEDDPVALRERAVDRRTFVLETEAGGRRAVRGYRGSSAPTGRRGLPVIDARLLVNLVFDPALGTLVDPFAGVGGVVIEALAAGWRCVSTDIDPALRFGVQCFGGRHCLADARALPLRPRSIDAVATEPPYDPGADEAVRAALRTLYDALRPEGRMALLCAARQASLLRQEAEALGFVPYLDTPVDRKGTEVVALAWQRPGRPG